MYIFFTLKFNYMKIHSERINIRESFSIFFIKILAWLNFSICNAAVPWRMSSFSRKGNEQWDFYHTAVFHIVSVTISIFKNLNKNFMRDRCTNKLSFFFSDFQPDRWKRDDWCEKIKREYLIRYFSKWHVIKLLYTLNFQGFTNTFENCVISR